MDSIGKGEPIEIDYLRDDPHTIRLPGHACKGVGPIAYSVDIAPTLREWLFPGMFRSSAQR